MDGGRKTKVRKIINRLSSGTTQNTMDITIKGKQGEGKTELAKGIAVKVASKNEKISAVILFDGKIKQALFIASGRAPFQKDMTGCIVIDGIPKGKLKTAKKAVKDVRLSGADFSVIYVIQEK